MAPDASPRDAVTVAGGFNPWQNGSRLPFHALHLTLSRFPVFPFYFVVTRGTRRSCGQESFHHFVGCYFTLIRHLPPQERKMTGETNDRDTHNLFGHRIKTQ